MSGSHSKPGPNSAWVLRHIHWIGRRAAGVFLTANFLLLLLPPVSAANAALRRLRTCGC